MTSPTETLADLFDDEPVGYDPISEAVRLARYGLSVSPWVLTGRDKNPAFKSSWLDNSTSNISDVVQDFELAVSRYGTDRVLVGWAIGKDGYCAIDDDHGLADSVAVVLEHPHAINETHRGRHIIFRNPDDFQPGNSTDKFPDRSFGEVRGRGGCIIIAGADRPGFDPTQLGDAGPFPYPEWLTPANDSAPAADDQTVVAFLADHDQRIDTDRLDHVIHKLDDDETPSRHGRLIKYAGWLMREARAGIVTAVEARAALWTWWENSGVRDDYPRIWQTDFHRYIACAIGYANAEPDEEMVERLNKAKAWAPLRLAPTAGNGDTAPVVSPLDGADGRHYTDVGNADRLIATHGDHVRFVPRWARWLVYDGGCWRLDHADTLVAHLAASLGRQLLGRIGSVYGNDKQTRDLLQWIRRSESAAGIAATLTVPLAGPVSHSTTKRSTPTRGCSTSATAHSTYAANSDHTTPATC